MTTDLSKIIEKPGKPVVSAEDYVQGLGLRARQAARKLASATTEQKNLALTAAAEALRETSSELITANALDVANAQKGGRPASFIDRLELNEERIESMATALEKITELADPVGRSLMETKRPNGLMISRVATPIGVIGMIYESRPNVGADAGALCIKSGNAIILRGGSESLNSSRLIVEAMQKGLAAAQLPEDCVQLIDSTDRAAVGALLRCIDYVDLVIPRGGRSLVQLVRDEARVPTLLHLDGNCHSYVHSAANLQKSVDIVRNAKLRRTGICGATESLVVDDTIAKTFIPLLADALVGCQLRGDPQARDCDPRVIAASDSDWREEYLDAVLSIKVVSGLDEACAFISEHSSGHTEAILTEDPEAAEMFLTNIDSAVVMHNASTQFSDGGEFGMGAEIGIATGKMHARGPVGLEQLTSFKYQVRGDGQTRS
ncbi:glutamate-5-semialdehyde dehydrogenase [Congregibacter variabilis]|uniref:Gamma-glutamyl phosphate reductase n=1 Tax=Congregibacter variabilis TaxID=3081200 RepID=A0ABZ0I2H6_9GAMM|nr:glutamate-5-semialdehyde dehydrogenase [Congregibacter sp. IMCC43200]